MVPRSSGTAVRRGKGREGSDGGGQLFVYGGFKELEFLYCGGATCPSALLVALVLGVILVLMACRRPKYLFNNIPLRRD